MSDTSNEPGKPYLSRPHIPHSSQTFKGGALGRSTRRIDEAWQANDVEGVGHALEQYASETEQVVRLIVENSLPKEVSFVLEPLGDEFPLAPHAKVCVLVCEPKLREPGYTMDYTHVEIFDGAFVVYAPFGSLVYVVEMPETEAVGVQFTPQFLRLVGLIPTRPTGGD